MIDFAKVRLVTAVLAILPWLTPAFAAEAPGDVVWSASLAAFEHAPAVGADGTIYAATSDFFSADNHLVALAPDGTLGWEVTSPIPFVTSPALMNDALYVGGSDGLLRAYSTNGAPAWTFDLGAPSMGSPVLGVDGTVFVGSGSGSFYSIRPSGDLKWRFDAGIAVTAAAAIGFDGTVYFGTSDPLASTNRLFALTADGSKKWEFITGAAIRSAPAIAPDGSIVFGCDDYRVYSLSPAGLEQWRFPTGDVITSSPVAAGDGTVYAGSMDGWLYALAGDGTLLWRFAAGGPIRATPVLDALGNVYLAEQSSGMVHALGADGIEKWSRPLDGYAGAPLVLAANSSLHLPMGHGTSALVALRTEAPPASLGWPGFRRDASGSGRTPGAAFVPLVVRTEPQSATVLAGTDWTLSAEVEGTAPLRLQWRFEGVDLPGANEPTLNLTNFQGANAGSYSLFVRSATDALTSRAARLDINHAPEITQVSAQTMAAGSELALPLRVADEETAPAALVVDITSSLSRLLPVERFSMEGTGTNRTVRLRPLAGQLGTTTLQLEVTDALGAKASTTFGLTVQAPADGFVAFTVPDTQAVVNTQALVPVRVSGFSNVTAFRWSLHWDGAVAQFLGVESFATNTMSLADFEIQQPQDGTATIAWTGPVTGTSLPEDAVVFWMRFQILGASGSRTDFALDGSPLEFRAFDTLGADLVVVGYAGGLSAAEGVEVEGVVRYYADGTAMDGTYIKVNATGAPTSVGSGGSYALNVPVGGSYRVAPIRPTEDPPSQGVTTLDITLLRRHILGTAPLTSAHQLIAADVNGSGSATSLDAILMRRLILGLDNTLPAGLWKFVPSDHVFEDPASPWGYPEARTYDGLSGTVTGQDYVAIKLGDVNGSWKPAGGGGPILSSVARKGVTLEIGPVNGAVGEVVMVPVRTRKELEGLTTLQMTLAWDPEKLNLLGLMPVGLSGLDAGHCNLVSSTAGRMSLAWDSGDEGGVKLPAGQELFYLQMRVLAEGLGMGELWLTSRPTASEASVVSEVVPLSILPGLLETTRVRMVPRELVAGIVGWTVEVESRLGVTCVLETTEVLTSAPWREVSRMSGTGTTLRFPEVAAQSGSAFYRVRVEATPSSASRQF